MAQAKPLSEQIKEATTHELKAKLVRKYPYLFKTLFFPKAAVPEAKIYTKIDDYRDNSIDLSYELQPLIQQAEVAIKQGVLPEYYEGMFLAICETLGTPIGKIEERMKELLEDIIDHAIEEVLEDIKDDGEVAEEEDSACCELPFDKAKPLIKEDLTDEELEKMFSKEEPSVEQSD